MDKLPPPPPPPPPGRGRQHGQAPQPPSNNDRRAGRPDGERRPGAGDGERRPGSSSSLRRWLPWVIAGGFIAVFLIPALMSGDDGDELTYSQFIGLVDEGQVDTVEVQTGSGKITGELNDGRKFVTHGGGDRGLSDQDEALLRERGVELDFNPPDSNWLLGLLSVLLPVLLIIGFFVWMQRRAQGQMGNVMSIGRSRAKAYSTDKPSTTFGDIAGYEGVKQEITEVVDFLRMPERFKEIGARVPKGILLVGPPGTGKTLFARAVAGEAGVGFLSVTGSDFMEMFVGVGASRVRDLFQQARRMGRAIIFIDEIDSIGRKRGAGLGGGHDEREQTLNQMLSEMDGFETSEGIVIMAATNRPDILDPALLRPGRFDRQIVVPLPEYEERLAILEVHSRDKRMGPDVDLQIMARATPGMAGADLANLVNEAALIAVRRGSKQIERMDFENARDRVVLGAQRESLILTAEEKKATAYHEGGHALLATVLPHGDPLHKVTILPRGMALGGHVEPPSGTPHLLEGVLRGHDLQGDGGTRRREAGVRASQLGRRQRPRTVHRDRPPDGPRVGHERGDRSDGVAQPAAGVPRRRPDVVRPRVQRRDRQAARQRDRPHPAHAGAAGDRAVEQASPRPRPDRCRSDRARDDRGTTRRRADPAGPDRSRLHRAVRRQRDGHAQVAVETAT